MNEDFDFLEMLRTLRLDGRGPKWFVGADGEAYYRRKDLEEWAETDEFEDEVNKMLLNSADEGAMQ